MAADLGVDNAEHGRVAVLVDVREAAEDRAATRLGARNDVGAPDDDGVGHLAVAGGLARGPCGDGIAQAERRGMERNVRALRHRHRLLRPAEAREQEDDAQAKAERDASRRSHAESPEDVRHRLPIVAQSVHFV